ncbi:hypothetical protein QQ045_017579 [Rhodiola kirilowii]
MAFFIAVVVGLSLVFAVLILAIAAELYYLLWWNKPQTAREIDEANTSYAQQLLDILSKRQQQASSLSISTRAVTNVDESDPEMGSSTRMLNSSDEESVESELMRLHNLAGPPRFLFPILEETKEDLESENGRSRTRSLSDVILSSETQFLTPIASPRITSPVLTLNPLYERSSLEQSPPPKFKFLRDAEDKLCRRMKEQVTIKNTNSALTSDHQEEEIGSLIRLISGGKMDREVHHNSGSSKIIPLPYSPIRF